MATLFYAKDFATTVPAGEIVFHEGVKPPSTINNNSAIVRRVSPSPFLNHIRIFLAIIRAVGLFPMKLPNSSEEYPQISFVAFTYSLCLYFIILYHIAIIYSHSIPRAVAPNQPFNVVLYIVGNLVLIQMFTFIPLSHWRSAKKYTALILQWSKFLEHFEDVYGYQPDVRTKKTVLVGIFYSTLILVVMGTAVKFGVPGKLYVLFEVCGIVIILSASAILYIIFCKNVQIVSDNLGTIFKQESAPTLLTFQRTLDQWMQLSKMLEVMNSSLNIHISISFFITTASGALAIFGLAIKLLKVHEPDKSWFMSFLFQISDTINVYILSNSAEKATKRLGKNIRRRILSCNFSESKFQELQQVDKFLQTMKINNPSLHVIGFVNINRRLFCKILSILATYLMVLIQFQLTRPYQMV